MPFERAWEAWQREEPEREPFESRERERDHGNLERERDQPQLPRVATLVRWKWPDGSWTIAVE